MLREKVNNDRLVLLKLNIIHYAWICSYKTRSKYAVVNAFILLYKRHVYMTIPLYPEISN